MQNMSEMYPMICVIPCSLCKPTTCTPTSHITLKSLLSLDRFVIVCLFFYVHSSFCLFCSRPLRVMATTSGKDSALFILSRTLFQRSLSLSWWVDAYWSLTSDLSVPDHVSTGRDVVMELLLRNTNIAYGPLVRSCQPIIGLLLLYLCMFVN